MLNKFGEVEENASLESYNTYGIKTSCKYLVKPKDEEQLYFLVDYLHKNKIKYYILGKGSNVILPDKPFDGVIISLEYFNKIEIKGRHVKAEAGVVLGTLVKECVNNNLKGFEYLAGIPGTLGGALYGNAGVKDHTIYDYLNEIVVLRGNEIDTLFKGDFKISYRHTEFKDNNDIILRACFYLDEEKKEKLESIIKENRLKRQNTQPLEYKNAGSVFKNPEGYAAGKLIEDAHLKGYKIGDAEVSEKHANFIINRGHATSEDIKKLIKKIQEEVKNKFDIKLELEQIIIEWD